MGASVKSAHQPRAALGHSRPGLVKNSIWCPSLENIRQSATSHSFELQILKLTQALSFFFFFRLGVVRISLWRLGQNHIALSLENYKPKVLISILCLLGAFNQCYVNERVRTFWLKLELLLIWEKNWRIFN